MNYLLVKYTIILIEALKMTNNKHFKGSQPPHSPPIFFFFSVFQGRQSATCLLAYEKRSLKINQTQKRGWGKYDKEINKILK